jgi:hypothetical protein
MFQIPVATRSKLPVSGSHQAFRAKLPASSDGLSAELDCRFDILIDLPNTGGIGNMT